MEEINKLDASSLDTSININDMLQIEKQDDVCSKQNIVINSTTSHINTTDTGNIDDDYDMGL